MKAPITTSQAMSHPTVVDTINTLGNICDDLRTQNQALVKELKYIAGISNGQVKRVADQALAALAQAEGVV